MEDSSTISASKERKEPLDSFDKKKPVERILDDIQKMNADIVEIKEMMKEMKQEFKDLNENAKKGWFY